MDEAQPLVTANCPDCGPVEVLLAAVILRVNTESERAALLATCSSCSMRFSTPTTVGENLLLSVFGVKVEYWDTPAEIAERPTDLPPLTHDDLVSFATELASGMDLVEWLGRGIRP